MTEHEPENESLVGALIEGGVEGLLGMLWTGLLLAGLALACILPVAGVAVGALLLWAAIARGNSKFLPIAIVVASVAFWIMGKSPLGMLPLILELFR